MIRRKRLQMKRDFPSVTFFWELAEAERHRSVVVKRSREVAMLKPTPLKILRLRDRVFHISLCIQ